MTIKIVNRENPDVELLYGDVRDVENVFNKNGVYCHRIVRDTVYGEQYDGASFPASEWDFYKLEYVKMF